MIKVILVVVLLIIWFKLVTHDALKGPMSGAIEAMMDGYNIIFGLICIFIRFGLPIALVLWLIF